MYILNKLRGKFMQKTFISALSLTLLFSFLYGCKTIPEPKPLVKDHLEELKNEFFDEEPSEKEAFRVFLASDGYEVKQVNFEDRMERKDDTSGDNYIMNKMEQFNIIEDSRESLVTVWVYPDTGKIMKIRPLKPTYLIELDQLIQEDIQRWELSYEDNDISPTRFEIRYKTVLQKKVTDEEIIQKMKEKMDDIEEEEEEPAAIQ